MTKIVLADDHQVLRQGLRALLSNVPDWQIVGEASDGFEVVRLCDQECPDVVILDLSMPNLGGVEAIHRLMNRTRQPLIVVLSAKDDDFSVSDAIKAGAKGYVTKSSNAEELQFAIHSVLKGQTYVSPSVCGGLLRANSDSGSALAALSSREREVMRLLSEGRPNREVAKLLHISPRTVDSHRANILKKLGVNSNAELVQLAVRHGMVE